MSKLGFAFLAGLIAGGSLSGIAVADDDAPPEAVFAHEGDPADWQREWPHTDFAKHTVALGEIFDGGVPRDGIPSIDDPQFVRVAEVDWPGVEPLISVEINGDARAYPLRMLVWHQIVNDVVGGVPVAVTYCPFCNTSLVFDRRLNGTVLEFGITGKLRHSGLVMYDRTTESWWQQFQGEAIAGELSGAKLEMLPARLESVATFKARWPEGFVLVPNNEIARAYGFTPYAGYDGARPFMYRGELPEDIAPLARVVRVGSEAWTLDLVRGEGEIRDNGLRLTWEPGRTSPLNAAAIAQGADVGNVLVERETAQGWQTAVYSIDFAFAFRAFYPDGSIHAQ